MRYNSRFQKKPTARLYVLFFLLLFLSFLKIHTFIFQNLNNLEIGNKNNLSLSYYNISMIPIHINDNGENSGFITWEIAAETMDWCTFYDDIYYIENLTIHAVGNASCIDIRNSDKPFIIRNCTLLDINSSFGGISLFNVSNAGIFNNNISLNIQGNGIFLYNTNNTDIRYNNCSSNQGNGIYLYNSNNTDIRYNNCSSNQGNGISFHQSNLNNVKNNTIFSNWKNGISLSSSDYTTIGNNSISFNANDGISSFNSDRNTFRNNTVFFNDYNGLYLKNCNYNQIECNMFIANAINGIFLEAPSGLRCVFNEIRYNIIDNNYENGLKLKETDNTIIFDNFFFSNSENGIDISYSHFTSIFYNSLLENGENGIFIRGSWNFTFSQNNIKNHNKNGIEILFCNLYDLYISSIWNNIIEFNSHGIYLYNTENTGIFNNDIRYNIQNGVYLAHKSNNNNFTNNQLSGNGLYCICYEENCINNIFENEGCNPVNLDSITKVPKFYLNYIFSIFFILFFLGIISTLSIYSIFKKVKMRMSGYRIDQNGAILNWDGTPFIESSESEELKFTNPKVVKPYVFYCLKCSKKYTGYHVFCPTCGERMKLFDLSSSLVPPPFRQKSNNKNRCIICYKSTCPKCNAEITGENSCFEECPYCESKYHKHCWDKTIRSFGKCGFCLEIPPSELFPDEFKE